jgi:hypothetical protein
MDLNQKYFEYQQAMIEASSAPDSVMREVHLEKAMEIVGQIEHFQSKLGAAASCAWSTSKRGISDLIATRPTKQDL